MKKLFALLMLAILIVSALPLALAERGEEKGEKLRDAFANREEKLKQINEQAKEKIEKAKERFEKVRLKFEEQRSELKETKSKLRGCRENNKDNCKETNRQLRGAVKAHLRRITEVLVAQSERLQARVEESALSDEKKKTISEMIQASLDAIKKQAEDIEALNASQAGKEEIKVAIESLKETWKNTKETNREIITMLSEAKKDEATKKHEEIKSKIKERVDDLKEKGANTQEIETLLADFDEQITQLKADLAVAKEKWREAKKNKEDKAKLEEFREAEKKIKESMKESREKLREMIKELRELSEEGDNGEESTATQESTPEE